MFLTTGLSLQHLTAICVYSKLEFWPSWDTIALKSVPQVLEITFNQALNFHIFFDKRVIQQKSYNALAIVRLQFCHRKQWHKYLTGHYGHFAFFTLGYMHQSGNYKQWAVHGAASYVFKLQSKLYPGKVSFCSLLPVYHPNRRFIWLENLLDISVLHFG